MKVSSQRARTDFTPRTLTITFETQKELDAFTTVLNASPITDALEEVFNEPTGALLDEVGEEARRLGGEGSPKHDEYMRALKRILTMCNF